MDRLRQLEIVLRVAAARSFSKAAPSLGVTPSAISHAIADLERRLRVVLFYRTTRQLKLTEEGEAFCRRGQEIVDRLEELEAAAMQSAGRMTGTLRVGMGAMVSQYIIMPRLPCYLQKHPSLFVECRLLKQPQDMLAEGVDLLLRGGEPPESNLVARRIGRVRFGIYASPSYLARYGEPDHPSELARHRCLNFQTPWMDKPSSHWMFERGSQRVSARINSVLVSDEREGVIAAALAGGGIIRMGMFEPTLITSGRLRRLLSDWTCPDGPAIYALYRKTARLPYKISSFIHFAAEAMDAFDPDGLTIVHETALGAPPLPSKIAPRAQRDGALRAASSRVARKRG
jgi:DNA-binding transcriptional LysR family regulator